MVFGEINLGDVLWSLIVIFFMVVYWMIFFSIVFDLFRDHALSGVAKAAWVLFLIVVPLVAMLAYVIVRGDSMAQRSVEQAKAQRIDLDNYVRETAQTAPADQIARAKSLLDSGTINPDEFESLKQKALA
jgi:ABC-type cobalamin transport system permease subunit